MDDPEDDRVATFEVYRDRLQEQLSEEVAAATDALDIARACRLWLDAYAPAASPADIIELTRIVMIHVRATS